jgi:hypothetical protein
MQTTEKLLLQSLDAVLGWRHCLASNILLVCNAVNVNDLVYATLDA